MFAPFPGSDLKWSELQFRQEKAVRFTRDVLGNPERADEIAEDSLEDYAQLRRIQITNPSKRRNAIKATTKSKAELEAENSDLCDKNEDLKDQLDAIADIVAPADEDENDGEDDDEEEDDQGYLPKPGSAGSGGAGNPIVAVQAGNGEGVLRLATAISTSVLRADDYHLLRFNLDLLFMPLSATHWNDLYRVRARVQQEALHPVVELSGVAYEHAVYINRRKFVRADCVQGPERRSCRRQRLPNMVRREPVTGCPGHVLDQFRGLTWLNRNLRDHVFVTRFRELDLMLTSRNLILPVETEVSGRSYVLPVDEDSCPARIDLGLQIPTVLLSKQRNSGTQQQCPHTCKSIDSHSNCPRSRFVFLTSQNSNLHCGLVLFSLATWD